MKYCGKPVSIMVRKTIVLPRPDGNSLSLDVKAVPIGWDLEFEKMWPTPFPPVSSTVVTKAGPEEKRDYYNSAFQLETAERNRCNTLYYVHCALRSCPQLEFATKTDNRDSLRALFQEYKDAGFTTADIAFLAKEIQQISDLNQMTLDAAKQSFVSSPPTTT